MGKFLGERQHLSLNRIAPTNNRAFSTGRRLLYQSVIGLLSDPVIRSFLILEILTILSLFVKTDLILVNPKGSHTDEGLICLRGKDEVKRID